MEEASSSSSLWSSSLSLGFPHGNHVGHFLFGGGGGSSPDESLINQLVSFQSVM